MSAAEVLRENMIIQTSSPSQKKLTPVRAFCHNNMLV